MWPEHAQPPANTALVESHLYTNYSMLVHACTGSDCKNRCYTALICKLQEYKTNSEHRCVVLDAILCIKLKSILSREGLQKCKDLDLVIVVIVGQAGEVGNWLKLPLDATSLLNILTSIFDLASETAQHVAGTKSDSGAVVGTSHSDFSSANV